MIKITIINKTECEIDFEDLNEEILKLLNTNDKK